ncbi:MAG: hypothetical protein ABIH11_01170 [Candidatus Altiarchaeota archaeon]
MREVRVGRYRQWVESRRALASWFDSRRGDLQRDPHEDSARKVRDYMLVVHDSITRFIEKIVHHPECSIRECKACCFFNNDKGVVVDKVMTPILNEFILESCYPPLLRSRLDEADDDLKIRLDKSQSHYVSTEDGVDYVYHTPLNPASPISRELLSNLPLLSEKSPLWCGGSARACFFLDDDGRCILYENGLKLGVCRGFICLTGTAVNFLSLTGMEEKESLGSMPLSFLNAIASRLDDLFTDSLVRMDAVYWEKIKSMAESHISGGIVTPDDLAGIMEMDGLVKAGLASNYRKLVGSL